MGSLSNLELPVLYVKGLWELAVGVAQPGVGVQSTSTIGPAISEPAIRKAQPSVGVSQSSVGMAQPRLGVAQPSVRGGWESKFPFLFLDLAPELWTGTWACQLKTLVK